MERDPLATFRGYLQSLPEDLLESVTEDYVWLAGLTLERGAHAAVLRSSTNSPSGCLAARGYFKILNMFEKSSVQPRNLSAGRSSLASPRRDGWDSQVWRSMMSAHEH